MSIDTTHDSSAAEPYPRRRLLRRQRKPEPRPEQCHNCGYCAGDHNFCPFCGQANRKPETGLVEITRDFWDEFIRVDSKVVKTLVTLMCHPGRLTTEYVAGRRVRYITPFRLYLTVSFLFFLCLSYFSTSLLTTSLGPEFLNQSVPDALKSFNKSGGKTSIRGNGDRAKINSDFTSETPPKDVQPDSRHTLGLPQTVAEYNKTEKARPLNKRDGMLQHLLIERLIRVQQRRVGEVVSDLVTTISRMMFVLLPVYALVLKVLYLRRRRSYVEHFVCALHVNTAWFVLLMLYLLWPFPGEFLVLTFGFLIYKIVAMRRIYGQSMGKTIVKTLLLYAVYDAIFVLATLVAAAIAVIV